MFLVAHRLRLGRRRCGLYLRSQLRLRVMSVPHSEILCGYVRMHSAVGERSPDEVKSTFVCTDLVANSLMFKELHGFATALVKRGG